MGKSQQKKNYGNPQKSAKDQKGKIIFNSMIMVFVLLFSLSAIFWPFGINESKIKVGEGNGDNTEIKKVEEVAEVFEFVDQFFSGGLLEKDAVGLPSEGEDEAFFENEHSSVTMCITDTFKMDATVDGMHVIFESTVDWTLYMNKEVSYYVEKGEILQQISGDGNVAEDSMFADLEAFVDQNTVYFKFNEYSAVMSGISIEIKEEYAGKWIQFSYSNGENFIEEGLNVDATNRETLTTLFEHLKNSKGEEGYFSVENDIYTKIWDENGHQQNLEIDLSDRETPTMTNKGMTDLDLDLDEYGISEGVGEFEQTTIFRNIDNTVIETEMRPEYIITSDEELMEMFIVKEEA